eukprot:1158066-Pelagomonas_calceolata.AAC.15
MRNFTACDGAYRCLRRQPPNRACPSAPTLDFPKETLSAITWGTLWGCPGYVSTKDLDLH